jgi:hypothetical protein
MSYITFEMTELEATVFEHIAMDPQEWIENAINHQVELVKDEIVAAEKARMLADPNTTHIPADRDVIVSQANLVPAAIRLAQQGE